MSSIGICLTSKNNYSMLEEWLSLYDYSNIKILNIDVGSDDSNIELGRKMCRKYGVNFIESKDPGMQICLDQASDFFFRSDINWFIYTHQDTYPLTENFFQILSDSYLNFLDKSSLGMIGFNIYHDDNDLKHWDKDKLKYMTLCRSPLELGDGYYRINKTSRVDYNKFIKKKPFLIEIPMWSTVLFSVDTFKKYIKPDIDFQFFLSVDDIAMQFLKNNIPNIAIPELAFAHDQSLKLNHKLPYKSPILNKEEREKLYGRFDHSLIWKKKWGFRYNVYKKLAGIPIFWRKIILKILNFIFTDNFLETIGRKEFKLLKNRYENTLLISFFNHDPKNGPYKYYDIKK